MAAGDVTTNLTRPLPRKCAVFDGVDDVIDTNQLALTLGSTHTVSLWVYLRSYGEANYGRLLTCSDYQLYIGPDTSTSGGKGFKYARASSSTAASTTVDYPFRQWINFIITSNSSGTCGFYYNGTNVNGSDLTTTPALPTTNLLIGNRDDGAVTTKGAIRDVMIYDRVLSQAEITKIANKEHVSDGLRHHWKLEDDYTDSITGIAGTNSGTYLSAIDDQVEAVLDTAFVSGCKILAENVDDKILTAVIQEA